MASSTIITSPFPGLKQVADKEKGVLGKWVGNGNTYVLTQIGTVPAGFPNTGQQQLVTIAGNHYWLFEHLTNPPGTLETIGIIGAITGVVAGVAAGAAAIESAAAGGAAAAGSGAETAGAGTGVAAAEAGAAGGAGGSAAATAASKAASAASSLAGNVKGLAALGAIGVLLTDPKFYIRAVEVIAGLYLIFLGVKTLTTGSTSPTINISDLGGNRPIRSGTVSRPRAGRATNRPANSPRAIRLRKAATDAALERP